jgi:hypothetical protein
MALRLSPRLAWQTVDNEVVVIDLPNGKVLGLNPTASAIWPLLWDRDEPAIVGELAHRFDVAEERVQIDVAQFIADLRQRGWVTVE